MRFRAMRIAASIGLILAAMSVGISSTPALSAERNSAAGSARPEIELRHGLVAYRTGSALLPQFLLLLSQSAGLELSGLEVVESMPLASEEGTEALPSLVARLLENYNYALMFGEGETANAGTPAGTLVIAGRKESSVAGESANSPVPPISSTLQELERDTVRGDSIALMEPAVRNRQTPESLSAKGTPEAAHETAHAEIGNMLGGQLSPFRTGPVSGTGTGQVVTSQADAQLHASNGDTLTPEPDDEVNPAVLQEATKGLQEATKRALSSVQKLARALEAASPQLSHSRK